MVTIRKCQPSDQKSAKDLVSRILSEEFPKERISFPTEDLNDISVSYGKLGEAFFVATDNGKVVGTIGVKQEDERTALLRRLFVESSYRGRKIGCQLVERAIDFCKEVGYDEIIFKTTSTMKQAIELCAGKGFLPKAKLNLGSADLVKFGLFLKDEALLRQSKSSS